jgi:hypothetical protein
MSSQATIPISSDATIGNVAALPNQDSSAQSVLRCQFLQTLPSAILRVPSALALIYALSA